MDYALHDAGGPDSIGVPQAQEVSLKSALREPRGNSDPSCRFATPTRSVPPKLSARTLCAGGPDSITASSTLGNPCRRHKRSL